MRSKKERGGRGARGGSQRPAPKKEETKKHNLNTANDSKTGEIQESEQGEEQKEDEPASRIPRPKATDEQNRSGHILPRAAPRSKLPVVESNQFDTKDSRNEPYQQKSRPIFTVETPGIFTSSSGKSTPTPGPSTLPPAVPSSRIPRPGSSQNPRGPSIQAANNQPKAPIPSEGAGFSDSRRSEDASEMPAVSPGNLNIPDISDEPTSITGLNKRIALQDPLKVQIASDKPSDSPPHQLASESTPADATTLSTSETSPVEPQPPPLDPSSRLSGMFPSTARFLVTGTKFPPSPLSIERPTSSERRPASRRGDYPPVSPTESDVFPEQQTPREGRPASRRGDYAPVSPTESDFSPEQQTSSEVRPVSSRGNYPPLSPIETDVHPEFAGPESEDPAEWLAYWDAIALQHTPTPADFPSNVTDSSKELLIDAFLKRQRSSPVPEMRTLKPSPAQTPTQESSSQYWYEGLTNIRKIKPLESKKALSPISENPNESGSRTGSSAGNNETENLKSAVVGVNEAGSRRSSVASVAASEVSQGGSSPPLNSPAWSPTQSEYSQRSKRSDSVASDSVQGASSSEQRSPISPGSQNSQGSRGLDYEGADADNRDKSKPATQTPVRSSQGTISLRATLPEDDITIPPNSQQSFNTLPIGAENQSSLKDTNDLYNASPPRSPPAALATGYDRQPDQPRDGHARPLVAPPRVSFKSPARPSRSTVTTGTGTNDGSLKREPSSEEPDITILITTDNFADSTHGTESSETPYTFDDFDDEVVSPPARLSGRPLIGTPARLHFLEDARPRPSSAGIGSSFVQSENDDLGNLGPPSPRPMIASASGSSNSQTTVQTGRPSTAPSTGTSSTAGPSSSTPQRQPGSATASGGGDPGNPDSSDDEDDRKERRKNLPVDSPDRKPPPRPRRESKSDDDEGPDLGINPGQGQASQDQGRGQNIASASGSTATGGSQSPSGDSAQAPSIQGGEEGLKIAPGQDTPPTPEQTPSGPSQGKLGQSTPAQVNQGTGGGHLALQTVFPPTPSLTEPQGNVPGQGRAIPGSQAPPRFASASAGLEPHGVTSVQLSSSNLSLFSSSPVIQTVDRGVEIGGIPVIRHGGDPYHAGRPADITDLFIDRGTSGTKPTPVAEGDKASVHVLEKFFERPVPAIDEEELRAEDESLPLSPSTPGFPSIPKAPPRPFRDPRLGRDRGIIFHAATARDGASPTEEQLAETCRGFQRMVYDMTQGTPNENLPYPDDEIARQQLDIENQIERSDQPEVVQGTRAKQILERDRLNFQSIFDRVRTTPQSILTWRSFAVAPENIETVAVELGNAAIDDALAVGTAQTNDMIAIKVDHLRLERENQAFRDVAEGRQPEGFLTNEDAKKLEGKHKWEMEKSDDEVGDRERSMAELLFSIQVKRENAKRTRITLARIRKERDTNKIGMRAAEAELKTLKDGTQPSPAPIAELERTQHLLVIANEEIAALRAITTTDMPESALRDQLATLQKKHATLERENITEIQTVHDVANRLIDRTQEKNELEGRVAELGREVDEAANTIEEHKQTIEQLHHSVRDLSNLPRRSSEENKVQSNLKLLQGTIETLTLKNNELKNENAELLDPRLRHLAGQEQGLSQASAIEDALRRQIAILKKRLNKAESATSALRSTMHTLAQFIGRPTELLDYTNTIIDLQTENTQLRAGFLPEVQAPSDPGPLKKEVLELRAQLTRLKKEAPQHDANPPTIPVAAGQASRAKLVELEEQLIKSIESNEAISSELVDVKNRLVIERGESKRMSDLNRRVNRKLEARIASLSEKITNQASNIKSLKKIIEGQVFKSMDITGEENWDDRDRMWAALDRPEVLLALPDDDDSDNLVLSEIVIDLGITRVQVQLHNLMNERALHGMQDNDAEAAVDVAREVVKDAKLLKDPVMLARAYFWYAIVLYYYDDIFGARETFIEATVYSELPELEAGIVKGWVARLDDTGPERGATAYGGVETLTFEEAFEFQAQTRAEHRAAIREAVDGAAELSKRGREKAKRKAARQATRDRNAEKKRRKQRAPRPDRGDDLQPQASKQDSDSDDDSDFPRPGGTENRIRIIAEHALHATVQTQSGTRSSSTQRRAGNAQGQSQGSWTMTIEEPEVPPKEPAPIQSSWIRYIPFFKGEQSPAAPPAVEQAAKPREQYYYEPLSDKYILWEGKEFADDPEYPWTEDKYRRNEFEIRPIPDPVMGINPEYNSGAELANPHSKFNEAANLARVLHGGLLPNEKIPKAEELVGESGRGLYVTYEEGSEGWLYGQRILDDVKRRLKAIQQERDEHRTKEEVYQMLKDAADKRETESEEERMTREIESRAQQSYIRDQEYYGEYIDPRDVLAASEMAVKRWKAFQLHAKGFYDDTLFGPAEVNEISFRWLDEFIKNEIVQTRIKNDGEPMSALEARMNKWVKYTEPVDEILKETLVEIGNYMWEEYAEGEIEEESTEGDTQEENSEGEQAETVEGIEKRNAERELSGDDAEEELSEDDAEEEVSEDDAEEEISEELNEEEWRDM